MLPLADFGTVNFTGVSVDDAPIGTNENLTELTLFSPAGTVLAAPSALTAGNALSVTSDGPGPSDSPGAAGDRGPSGDRGP